MKYIVVKLQIEGFHSWPEATGNEAYLANLHRHVFHIVCMKAVAHNNREIEIIRFKREMEAWLRHTFVGNFGPRSCEDIAEVLLNRYELQSCTVLEDGENGAMITAPVKGEANAGHGNGA